jgi:hypothetical protein
MTGYGWADAAPSEEEVTLKAHCLPAGAAFYLPYQATNLHYMHRYLRRERAHLPRSADQESDQGDP